MTTLYYTKVTPEVPDLIRYSKGAAGFDLTGMSLTVDDNGYIIVDTGVKVAVPPEYVGILTLRSSFSKNYFMRNSIGIIDADYRGEVKAMIYPQVSYAGTEPSIDDHITNIIGQRFAQIVLMPISVGQAYEVGELPETERGEGGFGSTGTEPAKTVEDTNKDPENTDDGITQI